MFTIEWIQLLPFIFAMESTFPCDEKHLSNLTTLCILHCLYLDVCCCQHASTLAEVQYELDILGVKGPREEQNDINKKLIKFSSKSISSKSFLFFFGGGVIKLNRSQLT